MDMFCDEWLKVDALLQQKLKELQDLEKCKKLANEIASLKKTAKSLKA